MFSPDGTLISASAAPHCGDIPVNITAHVTDRLLSQFMLHTGKYHSLCNIPVNITAYVTYRLLSQFMSYTSPYHSLCHMPVILVFCQIPVNVTILVVAKSVLRAHQAAEVSRNKCDSEKVDSSLKANVKTDCSVLL